VSDRPNPRSEITAYFPEWDADWSVGAAARAGGAARETCPFADAEPVRAARWRQGWDESGPAVLAPPQKPVPAGVSFIEKSQPPGDRE